jgi:murein DD-endopeptidase MepM/ murein hydrolase activator NlpD
MSLTRRGKIVGLLVAGFLVLLAFLVLSGLFGADPEETGGADPEETGEKEAPTAPEEPEASPEETKAEETPEETDPLAPPPEPREDEGAEPVGRNLAVSFTNDWAPARPGEPAHEGTDVFGRAGAEVRAMVDGEVVEVTGSGLADVGAAPEGTREILIKAAQAAGPVREGDHVYYANLSGDVPQVGEEVEAGKPVGKVGTATGSAAGQGGRAGFAYVGWYDPSGRRGETVAGALNPYPLLAWLAKRGGTVGAEGGGWNLAFPLVRGDAAERPPSNASGTVPGKLAPDPLGVAEEGVTSGVGNGARLAANSFVTFAYGYSGDDEEAYMRGVNAIVIDPEYHNTPGGEAIRRTRETITRDGPIKSAAVLDDFEVTKIDEEGDGLVAEIRFSVGSGWGSPGGGESEGAGLAGDVRSYAQRISLVPWGTGAQAWKVSYATEPAQAGGGGS